MDRMIKAKLSQTLRLGKFMTGWCSSDADGKQADAGFFVFSLTVIYIYLLLLNLKIETYSRKMDNPNNAWLLISKHSWDVRSWK